MFNFLFYSMLYIFDLDYTLLDCVKLKSYLAEILGVKEEIYNDTYKSYFTDKGELYSFFKHGDLLNADAKMKTDFIVSAAREKIKSRLDKYLFPEAEIVLKKLKSNGHKLLLLTYGDIKWQKYKVENLGIKKYFDNIAYTDQKKGKFDFRHIKEDDVIIVNDNARECVEMSKHFPNARILLVEGPYSNNAEHDFEARALEELR
ncbi:hypothetical protein A2Y83_00660 [Candidatus Falkowbacteria bacterium RBG_13_39_14]|uniref:FCP1 homology domain-containing protein n=1 Tax=Candidatus Falkowbacteria bacterium RBG_13_39_14 TaxID=1797985 RepID=A0A1F5S9N1_9BACT|nr:MAG: hypothetical protein A2Y83_00660 [Candidatus Falkowbacteria bacterium RBG_13_39_14]